MSHCYSNSSSDLNNIQLKILEPKSDRADGTTVGTGHSNSCAKNCDDTDELSSLMSELEKLLDKPSSTSNSKKHNSSNPKNHHTSNKSKCDDTDELSKLMKTLDELTTLIDTTNPRCSSPPNHCPAPPTTPTTPTTPSVPCPTLLSTPSPVNIDNEREKLSTSVATAKLAIDKALESVKNLECNHNVFVEAARMYVQETYKTAIDFINILEKQGNSNKDIKVIRDIINKLKWDPIVKLFGLDKLVNDFDNEINNSQNNVIKFLSIFNQVKN